MKIDQIEIKTHGNLHVDPDSVFVCPECGRDSASEIEGEVVQMCEPLYEKYIGESIFINYYADVFTCYCKSCGCKWEEKRRIRRDVKWEIVVGIIAIFIVALVIMFAFLFGQDGLDEAVESVSQCTT